jgi:two-component system nitrate/nitrite response regulator NarL
MSLNIILIDDHTLFREGLVGLLSRRHINVLAAVGTGHEGLKLATELNPDVILLDMRMPEMDGMDVLRQLRQRGFRNPVAMLTTSSDERDLV